MTKQRQTTGTEAFPLEFSGGLCYAKSKESAGREGVFPDGG